MSAHVLIFEEYRILYKAKTKWLYIKIFEICINGTLVY